MSLWSETSYHSVKEFLRSEVNKSSFLNLNKLNAIVLKFFSFSIEKWKMSSYEDELILQTQINYENYFIAVKVGEWTLYRENTNWNLISSFVYQERLLFEINNSPCRLSPKKSYSSQQKRCLSSTLKPRISGWPFPTFFKFHHPRLQD